MKNLVVILILYNILVPRFIDTQHTNLNKRSSGITTEKAHLTHARVINASKTHGRSDQNLLLNILNKIRGIYVHEDATSSFDFLSTLKQTILITACNYGYVNHLHNFKCFMDRLGFRFVVFALDARTVVYVKTHMRSVSVYEFVGRQQVEEASSIFRTPQFNLIGELKIEAVRQVLLLGFNVLFADIDVAIVNNPLPYMILENVDYVHTVNQVCNRSYWDYRNSSFKHEGNTGFYFVRSNSKTIELFGQVVASIARQSRFDDQTIFWNIMRDSRGSIHSMKACSNISSILIRSNNPNEKVTATHHMDDNNSDCVNKTLVTCPLDSCAFSSCSLNGDTFDMKNLEPILRERGLPVVTIHANCLKGNEAKVSSMKYWNLWLLNGDGKSCKATTSTSTFTITNSTT